MTAPHYLRCQPFVTEMNDARFIAVLFCLFLAVASAFAEEPPTLSAAIKLSREEKHEEAVKAIRQFVTWEPDEPTAWYLLGRECFLANQPAESVKTFDRYVKLNPEAASRQWERGISCYYAGQFKSGAKQFADYQTYHSADVENAAWRFLCTAKTADVETARKEILPIRGDRRVPMMEIYGMFKGEVKPEKVLAAAQAGDVDEIAKKGQLFYAHLYVGLYEEARGNETAAKKHITAAARLSDPRLPVNRYMWHVARIHCLQWAEAVGGRP